MTERIPPSRRDVEFPSFGDTLRGWLYLPESRPAPLVVMTQGLTGVKEMGLDSYAEVFAEHGLASLAFDHACFGASDGEPRQSVDPDRQITGYRDAITFGSALPEVDPQRIGVWGSSFSGGHAIVLAAIDDRVRCAVAQAPYVGRLGPIRQGALAPGDPNVMVPAAGLPGEPAPMTQDGALDWLTRMAATRAPSWRNEMTSDSIARAVRYRPLDHAADVKIPVLILVTTNDTITPAADARLAHERMPLSEWREYPGPHFTIYEEHFAAASRDAAEFLALHLLPTPSRV